MKRSFQGIPWNSSYKSYSMLYGKRRIKMKKKNIIVFIMFFFVFSCTLDHMTTAYGIAIPTIHETNPNVRYLIESGFWHGVELFTVFFGVCLVAMAIVSRSNTIMDLTIRLLSTTGVVRFFAGFHNLFTILQAL